MIGILTMRTDVMCLCVLVFGWGLSSTVSAGVLGDFELTSRRGLQQTPSPDGCATMSDRDGYDCMIVPPGLEDLLRVHWVIGPVEGAMNGTDAMDAMDAMNGTDAMDQIPAAGEGQISIALEGNTSGWVGFSFAESPNLMFPADAVVGWVAGEEVVIRAFRVTQRGITDADEDTELELTGLAGSEEDGVTVIEYTRSLTDGTTPIDIESGLIRTNAAMGENDQLEWHGPTNRVPFKTDFIAGTTETV